MEMVAVVEIGKIVVLIVPITTMSLSKIEAKKSPNPKSFTIQPGLESRASLIPFCPTSLSPCLPLHRSHSGFKGGVNI